MKIEAFNYGGSPTFAILVTIGILLGVAIAFGGVMAARAQANYRRANPQVQTEDPTSFLIMGWLFAFTVGGGFGLFGLIISQNEAKEARVDHYQAEVAKVAEAYPQLKSTGIELKYVGSTAGEPQAGDLTKVILHQGEFEPVGVSYERTEEGLDRSNLVAILNDDWTLEIFEAKEADRLEKIEPSVAAY